MSAPDWDAASHRSGGYLAEIPEPHVRFFPGPRRRLVRVFPSNLFRHYHTSMTEEDNPIWDGKLGMWVRAWDDPEADGLSFFKILDTPREVGEWVAKMQRRYFPEETHEIMDHMQYLGSEEEMPEYMQVARAAFRRANRREGD